MYGSAADEACFSISWESVAGCGAGGGDETNEIAASAPSMPTTTIDIAHGASHDRERSVGSTNCE